MTEPIPNVQPGDLARIVAPYAMAGRGAIVKVLRRGTGIEQFGPTRYRCDLELSWVVEGSVRDERGRVHGPNLCIADVCLRKIPPLDETDEDIRKLYQPTPLLAAPEKPEPLVVAPSPTRTGWEF